MSDMAETLCEVIEVVDKETLRPPETLIVIVPKHQWERIVHLADLVRIEKACR